jgi:hypothetical protein
VNDLVVMVERYVSYSQRLGCHIVNDLGVIVNDMCNILNDLGVILNDMCHIVDGLGVVMKNVKINSEKHE